MKLLLIIFIFSFSLNANEMKRIEAIVNDITKLRADYEGCQTEAKIYSLQLQEERNKNKALLQEINSFKNLYKREMEYKNKIVILNNKIKKQEKLLETKENSKKDLIIEEKEKDKETLLVEEKTIETIVLVKCEESNPFPKLVMKKEYISKDKKIKKALKIEKQKEIVEIKKILEEKEISFKASAFRFNKESFVYDRVNGDKLDKWSVDTSFTSSLKTQNWIKITGYFVNKVWRRSSTEMWVKSADVTKR